MLVDLPSVPRLLALSDIHGGYDRAVALLLRWGVIGGTPATPDAVEWSGADATLVVVGDLIDKGAQSVEVIDLFRALETSAAANGGHVLTMLGNHEAEFLADPYNGKAETFDQELGADGLDPCLVATSEPRGVWLRTRPLGARIGDWFFAHAGDTHGRALPDLEQALRDSVVASEYRGDEIIGAMSLLESRDWWDASPDAARTAADALVVHHIVFGHTPDALGPTGAMATSESGLLFRIDVGMSPAVDNSEGALLEVTRTAAGESARELRADGSATTLWP